MQKGQPKFAVICARGLGDALLSMILARNLTHTGYAVTTFSSVLCGLRSWFPSSSILPYPAPLDFFSAFAQFDTVIAAPHSGVNSDHKLGKNLILLKNSDFDKTKTMVDNLQILCQGKLGLSHFDRHNGITPPDRIVHAAHPRRVILHPTSSDNKKNWPPTKYMTLARHLERRGLQPYFCVTPAEAVEWKHYVPLDQLSQFSSLDQLAAFIYESGYLIGNDSGLGHLASALGIPTLSLFARRSYSRLWRPGWGPGHVVSPPALLPGAHLQQKYWKQLLSVSRVMAAFEKMREEC